VFISRVGYVLFAVLLVVSGILWMRGANFKFFLGAVIGGILSISSFRLLKGIGHKILEDPKDPKLHYFVFIWVRFFVLIAICFWLVYKQYVNVISFALGLSIVMAAVFIATIYSIIQEYRGREPLDFEEKFIGYDDMDRWKKFGYKPRGKKTPFDEL
jgi:hypothetical protein